MAPGSSMRHIGLCFTCIHVEVCTARSNGAEPIIFCEHFEDTEPAERHAARDSFRAPRKTLSGAPELAGPYQGLCVNCDARDDCVLREPNTVVWSCEEYDLRAPGSLIPDSLLPPFRVGASIAAPERPRKTYLPRDADPGVVSAIVEKHEGAHGGIIAILEEIQSEYGYLPQEALLLVAEQTGRPLTDIYGIATFYRFFSLKPRGRHLVSVCLGTACHVRGASLIVGEFERHLGVKPGETTSDRAYTLETVNCLGACALGPVVVADTQYFSKVRQSKIKQIITRAESGTDDADVAEDPRVFSLALRCPRCEHTLMDETHLIDGHPSVHLTASFCGEGAWVRLSCLYGSRAQETENDIPVNAVVTFLCPHCRAELTGDTYCPDCDSPMLSLPVAAGGTLQLCSRRACKSHRLDLR